MPVLGGLKAERGRVGRDFGPLLRTPTPPGEMGEMGGGVVMVVAIIDLVFGRALAFEIPSPSHFPTFNLLTLFSLLFCFRRFPFGRRQHMPDE